MAFPMTQKRPEDSSARGHRITLIGLVFETWAMYSFAAHMSDFVRSCIS
jgi:hypothetical protein